MGDTPRPHPADPHRQRIAALAAREHRRLFRRDGRTRWTARDRRRLDAELGAAEASAVWKAMIAFDHARRVVLRRHRARRVIQRVARGRSRRVSCRQAPRPRERRCGASSRTASPDPGDDGPASPPALAQPGAGR